MFFKPRPKVSVVIPCYNQGEFLADAISSILAQTFQNFEIIVVNDGSTDPNSIEILKNLHYPKTRVIHQKNLGPSGARNAGAARARGEYLLSLDADDKLADTFLEKAVRILKDKPKVAIVHCGMRLFGPNAQKWPEEADLPAYSVENMLFGVSCIGSCALYRRKCWAEAGGFDPKTQPCEDRDFWLSIIERGHTAERIDERLYFYRKHTGSITWKTYDDQPAGERDKIVAGLLARLIRKHSGIYLKHAEFIARKILNLPEPRKVPAAEKTATTCLSFIKH